MAEQSNRTFICSVLFFDIAAYSQRSVAEQIRLKERFNAVLTEAISGVATDDRIILDTGDGAAVSFLGDPEDAMFAGLSLRDAVLGQDLTGGPRLQVRVGINLGPVRLVKDINGQPNIIGDGINVAQRVMSFADPGQILVSRSYYDVMARLSEDYGKLFHYEGAKTDKHVREHEVYAINTAPSSLRRTVPPPAPKQGLRLPSFKLPSVRLPALRIPKVDLRPWAARLAVNSKLLLVAPVAFILIVGTGVVARGYRNGGAEANAAAPTPRAAVPKVEAPPAKIAAAEPVPPKATEPSPPARAKAANAPPARTKTPLVTAKAKEAEAPPKARETTNVAAARPSAAPAQETAINIVALPWADVYVDGTKQGVSPPLRSIPVSPGKHQVELRNSSFSAHVETVDVKRGTQITIRHRFRR